MNVKTYRAKTMQEALALVRRDLGPQASVLRTREVPRRRPAELAGRLAIDRGSGIEPRFGPQPPAATHRSGRWHSNRAARDDTFGDR